MGHHIRKIVSLLAATALVGVCILSVLAYTPPVLAAIRTLEEAPGQVVYQSRQTLQDQYGHRWQAIAFNRIRTNGNTSFYLRLVGFPGSAEIDRSQPLTLTNSLGTALKASDASSKIFTDTSAPEPHVGQYDLKPIVSQLQPVIPLQLSLPTVKGARIQLSVSPTIIQEWQTMLKAT